MSETPETGLCLRQAGERDIPDLARHHRLMFEEIWENDARVISPAAGEEVEAAYARKLRREMPQGACLAWVFRGRESTVASGAMSLVSFVPTPVDLSSTVAYVHSIFTHKNYRGRGLAQRIMEQAIEHCRATGIRRAILNASDAGRPLYEKLGFVSLPETMYFFIE